MISPAHSWLRLGSDWLPLACESSADLMLRPDHSTSERTETLRSGCLVSLMKGRRTAWTLPVCLALSFGYWIGCSSTLDSLALGDKPQDFRLPLMAVCKLVSARRQAMKSAGLIAGLIAFSAAFSWDSSSN